MRVILCKSEGSVVPVNIALRCSSSRSFFNGITILEGSTGTRAGTYFVCEADGSDYPQVKMLLSNYWAARMCFDKVASRYIQRGLLRVPLADVSQSCGQTTTRISASFCTERRVLKSHLPD